jgi:hypothetical protein
MTLTSQTTSFEHTLEIATYHAAEVFTMQIGERRTFGLAFKALFVRLEVECVKSPLRAGRSFVINGQECGNEHGARAAVARAYAPVLHATARACELKAA